VSLRPAVFLDRDGVINVFPGPGKYVLEWSQFAFMPQVRENLARLRKAGFALVLVTSQSGVGRALMTQATLDEIHTKMQEGLGTERLDAIYFCPHHPDDGCACRKPSPWMIQQAAREHGLDLQRSFVVGDTSRDIVMGRAAGCRTILCRPNLPRQEDVPPEKRADRMVSTLAEAADWVLSTSGCLP
jgi:histidinol-phosphate phosphatase family protein